MTRRLSQRAFGFYLAIAVFSCQLTDCSERVDKKVLDSDLARRLTSASRHERRQALSVLQAEDVVPDIILEALVESFRYETVMYLPGPPATTTQASLLLIKFSPASIPHLVNGLSSADTNVRRHTAYTLGELRKRTLIPALRDAIDAELQRAAAAMPSSADPRMTIAPLRAMVDAYGKTSHVDALRWIADRMAGATTDLEADLLLASLGWLEPDGPRCDGGSRVTCANVWTQWIGEKFNVKRDK